MRTSRPENRDEFHASLVVIWIRPRRRRPPHAVRHSRPPRSDAPAEGCDAERQATSSSGACPGRPRRGCEGCPGPSAGSPDREVTRTFCEGDAGTSAFPASRRRSLVAVARGDPGRDRYWMPSISPKPASRYRAAHGAVMMSVRSMPGEKSRPCGSSRRRGGAVRRVRETTSRLCTTRSLREARHGPRAIQELGELASRRSRRLGEARYGSRTAVESALRAGAEGLSRRVVTTSRSLKRTRSTAGPSAPARHPPPRPRS